MIDETEFLFDGDDLDIEEALDRGALDPLRETNPGLDKFDVIFKLLGSADFAAEFNGGGFVGFACSVDEDLRDGSKI